MSKHLKSTDAAMMLPFLNHPKKIQIRLEVLYSLIFQIAAFYFLDLNFKGWILCYWIFGLNWGSLQYADHAWSARDIRNGAWNLKVPKFIQSIYLNYHLHLAHHQHPNVPWTQLEDYVAKDDPKPSYLKIYLEMWKGPRPVSAPPPPPVDIELQKMIEAT